MKKISYSTIVLLSLLFMYSCSKPEKNGDPTEEINQNIQLPAGSFVVDPDTAQIDNSIVVGSPTPSGQVNALSLGVAVSTNIPFQAPNRNVVAAGMRFGDQGKINFVPVPQARGQANGTMTVPFSVSQSTCNNLSNICHNIKCYEFAMTADGKISRANIRDVAISCGKCDEPSCQGIINVPCNLDPGEGVFSFKGISNKAIAACDLVLQGFSGTAIGVVTQSGSGVYIYNLPGNGTFNLANVDTDPNYDQKVFILVVEGGTIYGSVSGTVTRNGKQYSFSGTVQDISSNARYQLSGSGVCN